MNPHNRRPIFYKSVNPGLPEVGEVASNIFQWDETNNKPAEVGQGMAFMPPQEIQDEYVIWSDTYTLGYTNQAEAAPIFFSDGGIGASKILQIINTVSFRLGQGIFDDLALAKAWAVSEPRIFVEDNSPLTISSSGLIAHLDASNSASYSGSGTVWTDLTGNGHNATISGPTYSSANGGVFEYASNGSVISFNGANSLTGLSANSNISANGGFTAQLWVYRTSSPSLNIISKSGEYGIRTLRDNYTIGTNITAGPYAIPVAHSQWQLITLQGFLVDPVADGYLSPSHPWAGPLSVALKSYFNDIKNINVNYPSYDYYIDGQFAPGNSTNNPLQLANTAFSSNTWYGKVGAFYFYNRALTDQEVADNYNATKSRYGL